MRRLCERIPPNSSKSRKVVSFNRGEWCIEQFSARDDDDVDAVDDLVASEQFSGHPLRSASLDRNTHLPGGSHAQAWVRPPIRHGKKRHEFSSDPDAALVGALELWATPDSRGTPQGFVARHIRDQPSSATVSFFRPLARRRAKTIRPFFVAIRTRNPWAFARRRLFG